MGRQKGTRIKTMTIPVITQPLRWYQIPFKDLLLFVLKLSVSLIPAALILFSGYMLFSFFVTLAAQHVWM